MRDMSNKVDKFFKEKLEGHTLTPSAQAWEKLEGHLSKKNRTVIWVRIAAGIALLALVSVAIVVYLGGSHDSHELVKDVTTPSKNDQKPEVTKDEPQPTPAPVVESTPALAQKVQPKKLDVLTVQKGSNVPKVEAPQIEETVPSIEEQPAPKLAQANAPTAAIEKSIVLVYTLPALKKQPQPQPVVAEETKKTGLERVLEIAREVKNSDSPLADLRDAKDDILALDFKKDKKNSKQSNIN